MSFPEPIHIPLSNDHSGKKQTQLRTVRLSMPIDLPQRFSPSSPIPTNVGSPQADNRQFRPMSPQATLEKPKDPSRGQLITLTAPSIFYSFDPSAEPSFKFDILVSNNAIPFFVQPPINLKKPRFLLYPICLTPVSTSPIRFSLNRNTILHWATDSRPIDVTSLLMSFGQQNWLIVETGNHPVPFSIVGIWASYRTFDEIADEIKTRGTFFFNDYTSLCPLTGMQIEIPARGVNCNHANCFDLLPYLTQAQALTSWICPICGCPLPYTDLRVGERPEFQYDVISNNTEAEQDWSSFMTDDF
ncbi:MIZ zinc finger family protein [Histomonas meleagridis]|uniref:MIZ zinc finger family protein n=1 Tax=Histomonas meleagridis TaxID=135588 RepID=UPI0035597654|nr:MIZ zinc finger family protein [Histomonas meleagridis]KAH0805602.1 MIZ zinc finger family protein [Histomonas meleagridis]